MKRFLLKEIVVWLIIFLGLLVFFIFAYIIAGNKSHFFTSIMIYKTHLSESSGIYPGTKVTIHGKNTGNVIKTILLPNGNIEIRFSVRKSHAFGVTESSIVQLKNSGALGDRYINIFTRDLSDRQLKKDSLIPYQRSFDLLSILTGHGNSQTNIIGQIHTMLENINKKGVIELLSESDRKNLRETLKSIKNIAHKIESGQGTLGALVNDRSLYNRLQIFLGQRPTNNYLKDLSRKSSK